MFFSKMKAKSWRLNYKNRELGINMPFIFKTGDFQSEVDTKVTEEALERNAGLNEYKNDYFNLSFLKNSRLVREYIRNNSKQEQGVAFALPVNNHTVHGTFFDRNSPYLMVVTGGFSNDHEYMASFIKLFPMYDLVLFDLPGHGLDRVYPASFTGRVGVAVVGVDLSAITLGQKEAETICAVVDHFKIKRPYRSVVGVARCYSAPFFAQAAVEWQWQHASPLFDKLIIDSAFPAFDRMAQNFPRLYWSKSNAPFFRHISVSWPCKAGFVAIANLFLSQRLQDCCPLAHYLMQLHDTDMFFIHSARDVAISMADFDEIWQQLAGVEKKAVLFTHSKHAMNHIQQKELFKYCGELFIESSWYSFNAKMLGISEDIQEYSKPELASEELSPFPDDNQQENSL